MYHLADSLAEFVVFTEFRKQARIFPGRCTFLLPASYACNIGDGKIRYSLSASTIPCTDLVLRGIYVSTSGSLVQRVKAVVSHLDLGSGRLNRHHRHSYAPQRLIRTRGCTWYTISLRRYSGSSQDIDPRLSVGFIDLRGVLHYGADCHDIAQPLPPGSN